MYKKASKALLYRCLLTDTLPYEVPTIFSNDKLFSSLVTTPSGGLKAALEKIYQYNDTYTVPYNYEISKNEKNTTTLSVVHPLAQVRFADFYEKYSNSILNHCSYDRFSLRRPVAAAAPFARGKIIDDDAKSKGGVSQLLAHTDEPDVSHLTSYFSYARYNLIGRFIGSREFIRLETRFSLYRSIDVSKCFFNIYTHSISWAVKDKSFSKEARDTYSFESKFDTLMQRCNHNETNGIVVGPEFSRIFSEIILQSIDLKVERELSTLNFRGGRDYEIRRYVDDYFVFANSIDTLDRIEKVLRKNLSFYKLFVNERKVETYHRPFVSPLSLARFDVGSAASNASSIIGEMLDSPSGEVPRKHLRKLKGALQPIRPSIARYGVSYSNISGWLMTRFRRLVQKCLRAGEKVTDARDRETLADAAILLLEEALYVCAMDLRVRTTYAVCQIALSFQKAGAILTDGQKDQVDLLLMSECTNILNSAVQQQTDMQEFVDSVEVYNLLICGAQFVGADFLKSSRVAAAIERILSHADLSYFAFITLKFCFLKDRTFFKEQLDYLNDKASRRIREGKQYLQRDTQTFLLFCDFLSSPDVSRAERRQLFNDLLGGTISNAVVDKLQEHVGFVDWGGLSVEHLLRRKELRPVYS